MGKIIQVEKKTGTAGGSEEDKKCAREEEGGQEIM